MVLTCGLGLVVLSFSFPFRLHQSISYAWVVEAEANFFLGTSVFFLQGCPPPEDAFAQAFMDFRLHHSGKMVFSGFELRFRTLSCTYQ